MSDNTPLTPEETSRAAHEWIRLNYSASGPYQKAMRCFTAGVDFGIAKLQSRIAELEQWKREAVHVMQSFNIQEIGKEIGVPLGEEISPQVLPAIHRFKERIAELERENTLLKERLEYNWNKSDANFTEAIHSTIKLNDCELLNQTLMGLLENEVKRRMSSTLDYYHQVPDSKFELLEGDWQSYCKEHNLKIDTDGK